LAPPLQFDSPWNNTMRSTLFILSFLITTGLCCSHSLYAGAWTLHKGQLWAKVTGMKQTTHEEYIAVSGAGREPDLSRVFQAGERAPYRENGHYQSHAIFLDIFYGITDQFNLGVQVPYYHQTFENRGFRPKTTASGFSDLRVFSKYNLIQNPFVGTLKLGVKIPTGKYQNHDGIIPVGEGQWDFDLVVQMGYTFWPHPIYTNIDLGYRLRLENKPIQRKPGNEWFYMVEIGYTPPSPIQFILKLHGIQGYPARVFQIELPSDVKRITYLSPTLIWRLHQNFQVETALQFSLRGRNYPAGHIGMLSLSYTQP